VNKDNKQQYESNKADDLLLTGTSKFPNFNNMNIGHKIQLTTSIVN